MVGAGTNKSQPNIACGPAVILVRPQLAVNIGMCARAMANFGLNDLRLVNPREGWPRTGALRKGANAAAAGAVHLLEGAKLFDSLEEAIADLNFVWATTARERGQGKRVEPPEAAMRETQAGFATGAKHGILFGPERTGLDSDEVALADAIITFPVNPAYASLNLAQAVLLTGYEWFRAAHSAALPFETPERSHPATREMIVSFFNYFESKLDEGGFFRPLSKRPSMQRNIRNMFHRMQLTEQDVRTLWGAIVRISEGPRLQAKTRQRQKQASEEPEDAEAPAGQDAGGAVGKLSDE
ncbi:MULTISPECIES: RNA methyltransferase [unclassified Beijerinckia]|uniref:RNA methyltransferase n=1 Tax=unclassified Beijerinckia TaxID=2638183 RepID=UPI000B85249C|nr:MULTISPECIES: RNA methyltransferase [unclassified Beijerinckia]